MLPFEIKNYSIKIKNMEQQKSAIIIGAGLVGSLWAVYLSKAGYKVTIYERRSDIRKAEISAGKSINLSFAPITSAIPESILRLLILMVTHSKPNSVKTESYNCTNSTSCHKDFEPTTSASH